MTLAYERDLHILKIYTHTRNDVSRLRLSKVRARTEQTDKHKDRQTDRQTDATARITTATFADAVYAVTFESFSATVTLSVPAIMSTVKYSPVFAHPNPGINWTAFTDFLTLISFCLSFLRYFLFSPRAVD